MVSALPPPVQPLLTPDFPLALDRPFTTGQALAAGISAKSLQRLVREGYLRRVIRGVYAAAQMPDTTDGRGEALALVLPPGSVVTDWTACWYWTGVDLPNSHLEVPRLSVFRHSGQARLRNNLVTSGERWLLPDDIVPLADGLVVTTPIRTAWDLGRFFPPVIALGGMDALARHANADTKQLVAGVERFRRQRGVVNLRVLAPLVDGRAESLAESSLRWRWSETPGLPKPELQIPVLNASGVELFRIDLGVEELRFGAEYDGEQWHGEDAQGHDEERRETLELDFGWTLEVFRRESVYGVHQDSDIRLRRGIVRARERQARRFR